MKTKTVNFLGTRRMPDVMPHGLGKSVPVRTSKCAKLINIGARVEVVMAKETMEKLGTHKLNSMSLIFVGLV
jgi:hypothetical protein